MNIYTAMCTYDLHHSTPEDYSNLHAKLVGIGFDNELLYENAKRKIIMPNTTVVGEFYEDSSEKLEKYLENQIIKCFSILNIEANFFLMVAKECRWTAKRYE